MCREVPKRMDNMTELLVRHQSCTLSTLSPKCSRGCQDKLPTVQWAGMGQEPLLRRRGVTLPGGGWHTLLGDAARSLACLLRDPLKRLNPLSAATQTTLIGVRACSRFWHDIYQT